MVQSSDSDTEVRRNHIGEPIARICTGLGAISYSTICAFVLARDRTIGTSSVFAIFMLCALAAPLVAIMLWRRNLFFSSTFAVFSIVLTALYNFGPPRQSKIDGRDLGLLIFLVWNSAALVIWIIRRSLIGIDRIRGNQVKRDEK
jgi:hypothetical protein